jgi:excisionase family DNA binding protein
MIFPVASDTMSTKEAALRLKISQPTVRSWLETGELRGFTQLRGQQRVLRVESASVDSYLAKHGPRKRVRRASKARMAVMEKEIASIRALVEAGMPTASGLDRLHEERDELRAKVVALTEALARSRTVEDLQGRAEAERAAVSEHLRAALAAADRADEMRRAAIAELEEAVAASSRTGHAGALRTEGDSG